MFFKIGVFKNSAILTEKHLCWSLFLIKLQAFSCFLVNTSLAHRHSLALGVLLVVTRCHSLYHLLSFVVTRCHSMYTRLYKQSHSRWRKLTQRNSHWTGKLQLTLLFSYTFWEKLCSHTFKASLKEVMVIPSDKMKAKYMKEDVWKSFFFTRKLASCNCCTN